MSAMLINTSSTASVGVVRRLAVVKVVSYSKNGYKPEDGFKGQKPNEKLAQKMAKKGWVDASGREGKGIGAYRFAKRYGDINDYSPIYDPTTWSPSGDTYTLGRTGVITWLGLFALLLTFGAYLIYSTSALA